MKPLHPSTESGEKKKFAMSKVKLKKLRGVGGIGRGKTFFCLVGEGKICDTQLPLLPRSQK